MLTSFASIDIINRRSARMVIPPYSERLFVNFTSFKTTLAQYCIYNKGRYFVVSATVVEGIIFSSNVSYDKFISRSEITSMNP